MIRFTNTRTGRSVPAKDGRDLAQMVKIEQDRRTGLELAEATRQTPAERAADMAEANRRHRMAVAS